MCVCLGERGSEGGGGAMCSETGVCLYVGRPLSPDILITSGSSQTGLSILSSGGQNNQYPSARVLVLCVCAWQHTNLFRVHMCVCVCVSSEVISTETQRPKTAPIYSPPSLKGGESISLSVCAPSVLQTRS